MSTKEAGACYVTFQAWQKIHRVASGAVGVIGIVHSSVTFLMYSTWSPDAVWFLGTGLSLILLAAINWSHVGMNHFDPHSALVVFWANFVFTGFGLAAVAAVPEPQAFVVLFGLIVQAIAGVTTLRPSA